MDAQKILEFVETIYSQITEEQALELLDPCTKLKIEITLTRGHGAAVKDCVYNTSQVKSPLEISEENPPDDEMWEKILCLPPFTEHSTRKKERRFREVLLEMRANGEVPEGKRALYCQSDVNYILQEAGIPCRIVLWTYRTPEGRRRYCVYKMIQIW